MNIGDFCNNGWFSDGRINWIEINYPDELIDLVLESNGKKQKVDCVDSDDYNYVDIGGDYVSDNDEYAGP